MTFSSFNLTSLYQRCSHCLTVEKITVVKIKTIQLYSTLRGKTDKLEEAVNRKIVSKTYPTF